MHPKAIGDGTTLAAMLALEQAGYRVSVPFGENSRDLVPIEHVVATSRAMLRVDPARNGHRRRIRPSSRYRIGTVALGS